MQRAIRKVVWARRDEKDRRRKKHDTNEMTPIAEEQSAVHFRSVCMGRTQWTQKVVRHDQNQMIARRSTSSEPIRRYVGDVKRTTVQRKAGREGKW